jgi:hypothetical protein
LTHHKWELGDIGLALFVSHRHDTDEFPALGEGMLRSAWTSDISLAVDS